MSNFVTLVIHLVSQVWAVVWVGCEYLLQLLPGHGATLLLGAG